MRLVGLVKEMSGGKKKMTTIVTSVLFFFAYGNIVASAPAFLIGSASVAEHPTSLQGRVRSKMDGGYLQA